MLGEFPNATFIESHGHMADVFGSVTEQDMLALCNLPLADARKLADSIFGVFSGT